MLTRRDPRHWADSPLSQDDASVHVAGLVSGSDAGLATYADALDHQRWCMRRCQYFIGRELVELRRAGGAWAEIADWTMIDDGVVRMLVRASRAHLLPRELAFDRRLRDIADNTSANPFLRICEIGNQYCFHQAVAQEIRVRLAKQCADLEADGMPLRRLARRVHASQATVAKWIKRARPSG